MPAHRLFEVSALIEADRTSTYRLANNIDVGPDVWTRMHDGDVEILVRSTLALNRCVREGTADANAGSTVQLGRARVSIDH